MKLTKAQIDAMRTIERADKPRVSWFYKSTLAVLHRHGLIEDRFPGILHLTPAGRAAIEKERQS